MNARSSWVEEFWRILVLIGLAWAAGALFDQVVTFLLLALLAYTFRNLFNLQRLANWLGDPKFDAIPIHFGLWGDIYSRIARVSARQEQRETRLKGLLSEYASTASALPDAVVALDRDGRINWFNEAASRLLRLQTAKDIGQPLLHLLRGPEITAFMKASDYSGTLEIAAPGNSKKRLEMRIAPYGDGHTLLLAQDVTERRQQERIRRDFVANVSHELRTPLTVLSGFIENMQNDETLRGSHLSRPLELMSQQTERMRQIVEDLLLLARLESASTVSLSDQIDVRGMMLSVADECRALRADAPHIDCDFRSSRRLLGDVKLLRSALTNLVVNAVNHTAADGKVTLAWLDRDKACSLEVHDDGEGVAPEHIPRLTERFYRVDAGRSRERGGTGLGLAIVKHVLNRHDARLEIRSTPGVGSQFICHFPSTRVVD